MQDLDSAVSAIDYYSNVQPSVRCAYALHELKTYFGNFCMNLIYESYYDAICRFSYVGMLLFCDTMFTCCKCLWN